MSYEKGMDRFNSRFLGGTTERTKLRILLQGQRHGAGQALRPGRSQLGNNLWGPEHLATAACRTKPHPPTPTRHPAPTRYNSPPPVPVALPNPAKCRFAFTKTPPPCSTWCPKSSTCTVSDPSSSTAPKMPATTCGTWATAAPTAILPPVTPTPNPASTPLD